jgi:hypothetical protein
MTKKCSLPVVQIKKFKIVPSPTLSSGHFYLNLTLTKPTQGTVFNSSSQSALSWWYQISRVQTEEHPCSQGQAILTLLAHRDGDKDAT